MSKQLSRFVNKTLIHYETFIFQLKYIFTHVDNYNDSIHIGICRYYYEIICMVIIIIDTMKFLTSICEKYLDIIKDKTECIT